LFRYVYRYPVLRLHFYNNLDITTMKKLTEREKTLLAAVDHTLYDTGSDYYLLGGHGIIGVRYDSRTTGSLSKKGFMSRCPGGWTATDKGLRAARGEAE
jgi:hypothetical protein